MDSKHQIQSLIEDAICPICLDFFTDPVILECGHNFCRSCITQSWDREGRNSCPVCREEFADRSLRVSRALASITDKARALSLNTGGKESELHCEEHQEELKLFCETDKKLICLMCRDDQEHRDHRFMSIKEAVESYKEQSQNLLTYITSVFAELRQILNEKERLFLKDLREDKESVLNPMENNLRAIQEEINSIQEKLLKLQERMNQTDSLIFLKEETRQKRRISDDTHMLSVADGALDVGKFDHPYLLNTVFSEVPAGVKRVSVTLDVETAHPLLEVSEDRKRVGRTWTWGGLPDMGRKRFTGSARVLGSEGFTSGRHYWEVEVAGSRGWSLGVAAESVKRKRRVTPTPETGVWSIRRRDDKFDALTSPPSRLPAHLIPGRVGVYLSYESGIVSFYDASTKSHLHTFTGNKFTEKLYPFFGPWLRICSGSAPGV
ncbi:zinc-binding protein A33-like isoform X2 [Rhinoraja longicauda]